MITKGSFATASLFAATALLLGAAGAHASTTVFSDDFDGEGAPGASVLNYAGFSNWSVIGQVDLVAMPNGFGITCTGKCVDLDGSSGPGRLISTPINFTAGRELTLSFDLSGNQRNLNSFDTFEFTANFGQATDILGFASLGGFDPGQVTPGDFFGLTSLALYSESIAGSRGFLTYGLTWTPQNSGTMTLEFATLSGDNVGPVLDNVLVTQAVPEPATWAMMIGGFGLIGGAMRRRASRATA
jgi:hypothetical protein